MVSDSITTMINVITYSACASTRRWGLKEELGIKMRTNENKYVESYAGHLGTRQERNDNAQRMCPQAYDDARI
jgi:transcription initiation factor TFIIIB Brf1 subunit/transcription initiation factor TFIIB